MSVTTIELIDSVSSILCEHENTRYCPAVGSLFLRGAYQMLEDAGLHTGHDKIIPRTQP